MMKLRYNVGKAVDKFCEYMIGMGEGKYVLEGRSNWLDVIDAWYGLAEIFSRVRAELKLQQIPISDKLYVQSILCNEFSGKKQETALEHTLRHMAHTMMAMFRVTFMASVCLRDLATVFRRQPQLNHEEEREGAHPGHLLAAQPHRAFVQYDTTKLFHGEKFTSMLDHIAGQLESNYGDTLGIPQPIDLLDQSYIDRRCEDVSKDRSQDHEMLVEGQYEDVHEEGEEEQSESEFESESESESEDEDEDEDEGSV
ncbi:hypothetical protein PG984_003605 [Apiospora sp. TS-2023a]